MKTAYKPNRKTLTTLIHVAKRDLRLDEDTYRQSLQGATGKASCSDMEICDLEKALDYFKRMGWSPKQKPTKKYSPKTRDKKNHDAIDKIRALWITMYKTGMVNDGSETGLNHWIERTTASMNNGKGIENIEWLRGARVWLQNKTLDSLVQWQKRMNDQWLTEDLRMVSLAQKRTGQSQLEVTQQLLSARAIMWWKLFREIGIENSKKYCTNRKNLNR